MVMKYYEKIYSKKFVEDTQDANMHLVSIRDNNIKINQSVYKICCNYNITN